MPGFCGALVVAAALAAGGDDPGIEALQMRALGNELKGVTHRLVFESNRSGTWDIWIVNADGSGLKNLTNTPDMDEIHAHASPDGRHVLFIGDQLLRRGGRTVTKRAVYVMNVDGTNRRWIADGLQNPCWNHDGSKLALVRSNALNPTTEYNTHDLLIYELATGRLTSVRQGFFHSIFALTWSPDSKWFLFAQRGMKAFGYQLLLTDVEGQYVYPIKNYGCRPDFSPDGTQVAWNSSDQHITVGRLDTSALIPDRKDPVVFTDVRTVARVSRGKVYYVDWSPDGKYLAYARSDAAEPEHSFKGTGEWTLWVTRSTELEGDRAPVAVPVTAPPPGKDDKEPDWVPVADSAASQPTTGRQSEIDRIISDWLARVKKLMEKQP